MRWDGSIEGWSLDARRGDVMEGDGALLDHLMIRQFLVVRGDTASKDERFTIVPGVVALDVLSSPP